MNIIQKVNKKILLYIVCIICIFGVASKVEAAGITIKDPKMKEALQKRIGKEEITKEDLKTITELDISNLGISDLDGVQYMENLEKLVASNNQITDITPLKNLLKLKYLDLAYNQVSDISALRYRLYGGYLNVSYNQVKTFAPLRDANLAAKPVKLVSEGNTVHKGNIAWQSVMKITLDLRHRLPMEANMHHGYGPRQPGAISHEGLWSEDGAAITNNWSEYVTWYAFRWGKKTIKVGDEIYYDWGYGRDVFTVIEMPPGAVRFEVNDCTIKKNSTFDPTKRYNADGTVTDKAQKWLGSKENPEKPCEREDIKSYDIKYNNVDTSKVGKYEVYYQDMYMTYGFMGIVLHSGYGQKWITVKVVDDIVEIPVEIEWKGMTSAPQAFDSLNCDIVYESIGSQSLDTVKNGSKYNVDIVDNEVPIINVKDVQYKEEDTCITKSVVDGKVFLGGELYNVTSSFDVSDVSRKIKIVFDKAKSDVTIKKITEDSTLLPDAELSLAKVDGEDSIVIERWTTTNLEKVVSVDKNTTYTLAEDKAPAGYLLAKPITFRVNENNTVEIKDEQGTWNDTGDSVISMVDKVSSSVRVKKIDKKGNFVVGAKLKVVEGEGNNGIVVKEWESTAQEEGEQLNVGENTEYTLLEDKAPEGYLLANPITFRVNENNTVEIKDKQGKWEDTKKADLYMIDYKALPVHIYHTDIDHNVITGSSIKLLKRDDKSLVEAWKSEKEGKIINLGESIEYILSEEKIDNDTQIKRVMTFSVNSEVNVLSGSSIEERSVNNDYQVAEPIVFRVNQDGNVEIEELQGVWKDTGTNQLYLISKKSTSNGGNTQKPSDGENTQKPSDGEDTQKPSDGGNTQEPSDGGNTQEPSDGENTQKPSDGEDTQKPSDGEDTQKPSDGENTQKPSNGGSTHKKSDKRDNKKASNGGNTHKKSDKRNNKKAFSREDAQKESSDKDFFNKGKRGLWLEEKEEMTNNKNTGLLLGKSASIDVKGVQGQKNTSLPQTKDTIKTTIYIYALSFIFIVIGIIRRLFNKCTIK